MRPAVPELFCFMSAEPLSPAAMQTRRHRGAGVAHRLVQAVEELLLASGIRAPQLMEMTDALSWAAAFTASMKPLVVFGAK